MDETQVRPSEMRASAIRASTRLLNITWTDGG